MDKWQGVICVEGEPTGDGRLIEPGAFTWGIDPMPLGWCPTDNGGHDGAVTVGSITKIWRDGNNVMAEGVWDDSDTAIEAKRMIDANLGLGVSVDLDHVQGRIVETDSEVLEVTESARIRSATIVRIGAISSGKIESVQAMAGAGLPPQEWFENPNLTEPTALIVTPEGRVFGHVATWGQEHTGIKGWRVPYQTDFSKFNSGATPTLGETMPTGRISLFGGHADPRSWDALNQLASVENAAADVQMGGDEHGIWVAGWARDPEKARLLKASSISGHWDFANGAYMCTGVSTVNQPGLPQPRATMYTLDGEPLAVAAAAYQPETIGAALTEEQVEALKQIADKQIAAEAEAQTAKLRATVKTLQLKAKR